MSRIRRPRHLAVAMVLLAVAACTAGGEPEPSAPVAATPAASDGSAAQPSSPAPAERHPLDIGLSNQSFDRPTVRVDVRIDEEQAADEVFEVGNQHNLMILSFELAPGRHVLTATAPEHDESVTVEFRVPEDRYALLFYDFADGPASRDQEDGGTFRWQRSDGPLAME